MAYDPTLRIPKGTALTWEELDANFIDLQTELANLALIVSTTDTYVSQATFIGGQLRLTLNSGSTTSVSLDGRYLPLSGGSMSGHITLPSDPINGLHAASKQYVDSSIAASSYDSNTYLIDFAASSIDGLVDVDTTGVIPGQLLSWDGVNWVPTNQTIDTDTYLTDISFNNSTGDLSVTLSDGTQHSTAIDGRYVPISGSNMTGFLTLFTDPVLPSHAATKNYVDTEISSIVDHRVNGLSFDSNTNLLTVSSSDGNNYVTSIPIEKDTVIVSVDFDQANGVLSSSVSDGNVYNTSLDGRYLRLGGDAMVGSLTLAGDPTANLEAATKQYVDNAIVSANGYSTTVFQNDLNNSSINELLDVNTNPSNGQVLSWNGTEWVSSTIVDSDTFVTDLSFSAMSGNLSASVSNGNTYVTSLDGRYVNKNGDVMVGHLTLSADPTSPMQATTKQYVDNNFILKPATANTNDVLSWDGSAWVATAAAGGSGLGDGQFWQSMTSGNRGFSTYDANPNPGVPNFDYKVFQNDTSKPIQVSVGFTSMDAIETTAFVSATGALDTTSIPSNWIQVAIVQGAQFDIQNLSFTVPVGYYYLVFKYAPPFSINYRFWSELR